MLPSRGQVCHLCSQIAAVIYPRDTAILVKDFDQIPELASDEFLVQHFLFKSSDDMKICLRSSARAREVTLLYKPLGKTAALGESAHGLEPASSPEVNPDCGNDALSYRKIY